MLLDPLQGILLINCTGVSIDPIAASQEIAKVTHAVQR
jgi:hypothetical protein